MTRGSWARALLAASGSAALLLGALAFQYIADMAPCKLCVYQRWPHVVAVICGVLLLIAPLRLLAGIGALAALNTAMIGAYHVGVEQKWWEGPNSCTSQPIDGMSTEALLDQIMAAPIVRCDEIPWEMFGISMAGWNALISLMLFALWVKALRS